jgi:trigger factor
VEVSVESPGEIVRRLTIRVPAADLEKGVEARIVRFARTAKLPGFRPGKVPRKVAEAQFGGQALQEAAQELIDASYRDALQEQSIVPVGMPSIEAKQLTRGEVLEYTATVEVFPDIPRHDIKGKRVDRPQCEVDASDIDKTIETLRQRRTTWDAVTDAAEDGYRVVIDFSGKIDGEAFDGGQAENYPAVIGSTGLLPEFEEALTGAKAGDEISVALTFPEDYPSAELAGKTADFAVKVGEVGRPVLPDVDEELIKALGVEEGTVDAFRAEIKSNLESERDDRVRGLLRQAVFDALLDDNDFPVPETLIEEEIERAIQMTRSQLQQQGLPADGQIDRSRYREAAKKRVALGLIMNEVVKERALQPGEDEVRSHLEVLAASYDDPQQFISWHYADPSRLGQVEAVVVEEKAVETLLGEADVVVKNIAFSEFMNPVQAASTDTPAADEESA